MTDASLTLQAALPSPSTAVWQLGPVPIRAYALCIVAGIVVACLVTEYRLRRRGVAPGAVLDIAVWAVPAGIIGARIYHVITSPEKYFGTGGDPLAAFAIWEGGLGIWGAVAGGAVGAWFAARQLGIPFAVVADALAPGLPLAQAVGRFGNWFNNELYGGQTTLPWGLQIHRMDPDNPGQALRDEAGQPILEPGLYHPTFAYEALWNVGVALLVLAVDRRFRLGRGRAFALYVMGYTAGRFWIELMRTDDATQILGARLNVWTSALVFLGGLVYFLRVRGPREYLVPIAAPAPAVTSGGDVSQVDLSRTGSATDPAAPQGYRVVSAEQFRAYRETGALPDEPAAADTTDPTSTDPTSTDPTTDDPTTDDPTLDGPDDLAGAPDGSEREPASVAGEEAAGSSGPRGADPGRRPVDRDN